MTLPPPPPALVEALAERYRIDSAVGAGGMATVYRARDLKHNRDVAIKVLRPELAAVIGGERFVAEIETTAGLQHPHILPLFDSGVADTFLYYVMPFVEGESVADRLRREGQLPVDEAVRIAREAAEALAYAHGRGVVHRDVKPANLLLQGGSVVVSDFGIALAVREAGGERMTETGLSLGTPHYMSPEQATAERDADPRSDIYSLGAVLYEMLAGQPPHAGGSLQAVLASVLTKPAPPVRDARPAVPPGLAVVVGRMLERLPADRFQGAAEVVAALRDPRRFAPVAATAAAGTGGGTWGASPRERTLWGALAALLLVAAVAGWMTRGPGPGAGAVGPVTFEIEATPADMWLSAFPPSRVAIHPAGHTVYYVGLGPTGVMEVFARRLDALEPARLLPEQELGSPAVSPDGRLLAGIQSGGLRIVDLEDRSVRDVQLEGGAQGIPRWDDAGNIFMIGGSGDLVRIGSRSLAMDTLYRPSEEVRDQGILSFDALPLPGGRFVLLTPGSSVDPGTNDIEVLDLESGETRLLRTGAAYPVYLDFGVLTWITPEGRMDGARFDPNEARLLGDPVTLVDGVRYDNNSVRPFAVSPSGSLVYEAEWRLRNHLVWVDMDGSERRVDAELPVAPGDLAFSPDGRHLALDAGVPPFSDVYVYDFEQDLTSRLTTSSASDTRPSWTHDGHVGFVSDREGPDGVRTRAIYAVPVDGSEPPRLVVRTDRLVQQAVWRSDGLLMFREGYSDGASMRDIFLRTPGDTTNRPFLVDRRDEHSPEFSPDGDWVAYASAEFNDPEPRVFIRALDGSGGRIPVSAEAAISPLWAPDGGSLYYRSNAGMLMEAVLDWSGGRPSVVERRPLFSVANYFRVPVDRNYDLHPDGDRFVFVKLPPSTRLVVVTDWFAQVREALGVAP